MRIIHANGDCEIIAQSAAPHYSTIRIVPQDGVNANGSTLDQEAEEIADAFWCGLSGVSLNALACRLLAYLGDKAEADGVDLRARVLRNAGLVLAGNDTAGLADVIALEEHAQREADARNDAAAERADNECNSPKARTLQCEMESDCTEPVTHVDNKGYVYCTDHGLERRHYRPCRKLRQHEIKRLERGEPLLTY